MSQTDQTSSFSCPGQPRRLSHARGLRFPIAPAAHIISDCTEQAFPEILGLAPSQALDFALRS